jgi:hypothetical protein
MKLVGHLHGIAAYREAIEEYQPKRGSIPRDLVELVRSNYDFQVFPVLTPGTQIPGILTFSAGRYSGDGESFGINQLAMTQDGDIAAAVTTEQADVVLNDLMRLLDENLGYRLRPAHKTKSYLSTLIIEFDHGLEEYIGALSKMAEAINNMRQKMPAFNIRRLAFGTTDILQPTDPLVAIETAEFLIERRSGRPFEENRYFCSAPMTTGDHILALERIEAIARGETD